MTCQLLIGDMNTYLVFFFFQQIGYTCLGSIQSKIIFIGNVSFQDNAVFDFLKKKFWIHQQLCSGGGYGAHKFIHQFQRNFEMSITFRPLADLAHSFQLLINVPHFPPGNRYA